MPRPSKPPVAARSIKRRLELDRGPKRAQPKRDARPQYTLAEAQAALVGAEREERGAKKRRKKWRRETGGGEAGSDEGGSRGGYLHTQVVEAEAKWSLPPLAGGGEHRKSCHICTQGVASWRGDFSRPLGCSTCPLIWCSRCLTNIYSEFQEEGGDMAVHAFIAQANLLVLTTHHSPLTTWCLLLPTRFLLLTAYRLLLTAYFAQANAAAAFTCPMCLGACACQLLKGGKVMERHKRAGWVGVTGNADPSCSRPHLKKMQACTCVCIPCVCAMHCHTPLPCYTPYDAGGARLHRAGELASSHYSPLTTHHLVLTASYSLPSTHCLPLAAHCLLRAGQRRRRLHLSHVPGGVRVPAPQGG